MHDALINAIQSFTLQARADLEREAAEQLEGLYGWLPGGSFADPPKYPALKLPEARETRTRLEQYAADEKEAGFSNVQARTRLIRETAFTWLNRFVAFKMLETRRVLKTLLAPPERANAYLLWLADGHDSGAMQLHDAGDSPINAMGEGPRHIAFRRFLFWQCGELAREMSVLFDPETLASSLCPRPPALRALVNTLTDAPLTNAWTAGNEESIGWVYQGFNADEKAAVFASFQAGKKITVDAIPAATGIFTPRWVVRYLVENSLGRLWLEMHPDSMLRDKLEYLVPVPTEVESRPAKCAREILFLDPSCGSMHFGLVAFDLFFEMYQEELACAGQSGWPAVPSVSSEADIPAAIITHNIHGIDIDPRAVQVSALTLLIKARGLNAKAKMTDRNLACCNIEAITGGRLDAMIAGAKFDQPIYERILRAMAARLKDSNQLGSLLRPEYDLERLIDEERIRHDSSASMLPGFGESDLLSLDTPEKRERFFAELATDIGRRLDDFVRRTRKDGSDESHFVQEASKGLTFLRLVQQKYDVVATNPPYLDLRDYNATHKAYLEAGFPAAKRNLFAAFICRCLELVDSRGFVAMITGQSFMFISSYAALRREVLQNGAVVTLAQYDYNLFKERVDTAAFVIRSEPHAEQRAGAKGVYLRLVKERDAEAKRLAFEAALTSLRSGHSNHQIFTSRQSDFDAIPGSPWAYWMPTSMHNLYQSCELLEKTAKPRQGLATGDNTRFLRFWWEIGYRAVNTTSSDLSEAIRSGSKWFPYNKGGPPIPWHGPQRNVVNWSKDGAEIRTFGIETGKVRSRPQNTDFYFLRGVTWSDVSSKGFAARLSPGGFIHDVTGMTCFPRRALIPMVLGLLNSRVVKYLLSAINPTIHFQVGDIQRLPIPIERSKHIGAVVNQCVELARQDSLEDETTYEFVVPLRNVSDRSSRKEKLYALETEIDAEVSRLYGLSDEDLAAIDRELSGPALAEKDEPETESEEEEEGAAQGDDLPQGELARRWISYGVGAVLGRYAIGSADGLGRGEFSKPIVRQIHTLVDNDGIMPSEAGNAQDLAARTLACLNLMLGMEAAAETIQAALGDGDALDILRGWLDRFTGQPAQSFWRYHFQMYRKRPIYWPFQSPRRLYTVWVFHERFGPDTLFRIRNEFAEPRLRLAEREVADLRVRAGKERKAAKELDRQLDLVDDLNQFIANLKAIVDRGYRFHIDDGVLLNAAPLHEVLPSWPETRAAWKDLEAGKFDWAHQAMAYWPDRVKAACLTNKSFAIAHGLAVPEEESSPAKAQRRKDAKGGEYEYNEE